MKKSFLLLTTTFSILWTSAQWTEDASGTVLTTTDSVGIGISNPTQLLHVQGNAFVNGDLHIGASGSAYGHRGYLRAASNGDGILIHKFSSQYGDYAGITFRIRNNAENDQKKGAIYFERTSTNTRGKLHFALSNDDDESNVDLADSKLVVDHSGNVGIGTSSPGNLLEVRGTALFSNVGGDALLINPDGDNRRGIISSNFKLAFIADKVNTLASDKRIIFGAGGETPSDSNFETYMILKEGNVGIGTTSPASILDVRDADDNDIGLHLYNDEKPLDTEITQGVVQNFYLSNGSGAKELAGQIRIGKDDDYVGGGQIRKAHMSFSTQYSETDFNEWMRITGDGNVGIGTDIPDGSLHVHSATAGTFTPSANVDDLVVENSVDGGITIATPNQSTSRLYFASPADVNHGLITSSWNSKLMTVGTAGTNMKLAFTTGVAVEAMRIDQNQNVGIGTTTPDSQVEMVSYAPKLTIRDKNSDAQTSESSVRFGESGANDVLGDYWDVGRIGVNFDVSRNGLSKFHIRDVGGVGRVGIGTTTPQHKLEVDGTNNAVAVGSTTYGWSDTNLIGAEYGTWDNTRTNAAGTYFYRWTGVGTNYGVAYIGQEKQGSDWGLAFKTDNNGSKTLATSTRMFIKTDGNVGIGTTDPLSKLSVNGHIRATEVKVLLDISVPDYVFEPDYELRTLKETKKYIAENKHLPEIPSASEIEENGIDLGDMNMRLLKKIEELTLYQIELLERLEQAESKISELESKD